MLEIPGRSKRTPRRSGLTSARLAVPLLSLAAVLAMAEMAPSQSTSRVSVDSSGIEGNRDSVQPSISADGRYVAFLSRSDNLVPSDTNVADDVFVHDRQTGSTSRVSVDSAGVQANGVSRDVTISADGRYVVFVSSASNLVSGDTRQVQDVFVHDRQTGETSRVSVDSAGTEANDDVYYPSISADGRFVAFSSDADNLVPGDWNGSTDVFLHDRLTGETSRVSVDSAGRQTWGASYLPSISADGRHVAFLSFARAFVPGDTNLTSDIFVHDRQTSEISRVSVDSAGVEGNGHSGAPSISADGRFVAFSSFADNLVPGDANQSEDVFVHDRWSGVTERVSVDSFGAEGTNLSRSPSISADGSYVAFSSYASNLVAGDTNGSEDVFGHDRTRGETKRLSVDSGDVQANSDCFSASISADARFAAFHGYASNLVPGDANRSPDVFVRQVRGCRDGNVNAGAGALADVLFVNDSTGGPERTVRLLVYQPFTIFVAAPPSASESAPFALYAWRGLPDPGTPTFSLPFAIGETCLPTPLTGGSPAPRAIWNNTGSPLLGVPTRPSSPAPSIVVQVPRGLGRPGRGFVQGIIRDRGAPNGRAAVTNGVTIEIQ